MSEAGAERVRRRLFPPGFIRWLRRYPLPAYRPRFRDWHFWVVQGFVVLIVVTHNIFEARGLIYEIGMLYFLPISLLLVPVIYAAINFGFVGSVSTALWATVVTVPNTILYHHGVDRFWEVFQLAIVVVVAVFLGQRVDGERDARERAEAARAALRASEMKYRGLFESSPIAILLLDSKGTILDANSTAGVLFEKTPATLKTMTVADLVGKTAARKLLDSAQDGRGRRRSLTIKAGDGSEVHLEPMLTQVSDAHGDLAIQVVLQDATEEWHRQAGLRAYAAYVLRAHDEAHQRIARELHDQEIQQLALLCRQLDSVEETDRSLPRSVISSLRQARRTAEEVGRGLRDFAKALRPPILDDLGMVASIRRLVVDFEERTGIEGRLEVVGEEQRLSSDAELGVFRIAQEALWNVERHSRATEVSVTVGFADHEARLDIFDNGVGFTVPPSPDDFTASGQLGLISMQERARLLSGKLEIQSSPGHGTLVITSIPVK